MHGRELRKLFAEFNRRYFGNRLPEYRIRVGGCSWMQESGVCIREKKLIRLTRGQPDHQLIGCLLHEMAHAATSGGHGMAWKREMIRLREAGASLLECDANIRLDDWDGRWTKAHFSSSLWDVLHDAPHASFTQVVRWLISTEGGPANASQFVRMYPWAKRVFREAQREVREEKARAEKLGFNV